VEGDTRSAARFIGYLTENRTRLNVFSALTDNDNADHFSFTLRKPGRVQIGISGDSAVKLELLEMNGGRVIFNNSAKSTDPLYKAAEDASQGKLELKAGTYVLRTSRIDGTDRREKPNYIVQLVMGDTFTEDYETLERPRAKQAVSVTPQGSLVASQLGDSGSFLDNGGLVDLSA
jgi:hypothetical protein